MTFIIKPFNPTDYPKKHWCNEPLDKGLTVQIKNRAAVIINPTDNRAFRLIVKPYRQEDFNLDPQSTEHGEVYKECLELSNEWIDILKREGLFPQLEFAANNSMTEEDGKIRLGQKEPYFPHFHIICRAPKGFKLGGRFRYMGPDLGEEFYMKDGKTVWKREDQEGLAKYLRTKIEKVK